MADASARPLPPHTGRTVDELPREALPRRPDLLADVAKLRTTDANIAAACSELGPKLSVSGNVQGNIGRLSVAGTPYLGVEEPQGALLLNLEWPLYEGGLLQNKLHLILPSRNAKQRRTN